MKTYTTKSGQNIYDVCLTLYGSIEGLFDLLVSNYALDVEDYGPQELYGKPLSLDTTITRGIKLKYHEGISINSDVIDYVEDNDLSIAHGEHTIPFFSEMMDTAKAVITQNGILSAIAVTLLKGTMTIDWGDFSEPDVISDKAAHEIEHAYKTSSSHTITLYGDFECINLDVTEVNGTMYPVDTIKTISFKSNSTSESLKQLIQIIG